MMNIWERKVYNIFLRLNSKKPEKMKYECRRRFSTNPQDWHILNNYERDTDGQIIVKDYLGQFTPLQNTILPKIQISTSIEIDLPTKVYDSIIKNECFVLCTNSRRGYIYNPSTLKEYSFNAYGIIKSFNQYDSLREFIKAAKSEFVSHRFFFTQKRWYLSNGRIKIF